MTAKPICLRHGYNCSCEDCLPWLNRWEKEINGFALFNRLKEEGKPLYVIFEMMGAEFNDLVTIHHDYLEDQYFEHKFAQKSLPPNKKRRSNDSDKSSTIATPTTP